MVELAGGHFARAFDQRRQRPGDPLAEQLHGGDQQHRGQRRPSTQASADGPAVLRADVGRQLAEAARANGWAARRPAREAFRRRSRSWLTLASLSSSQSGPSSSSCCLMRASTSSILPSVSLFVAVVADAAIRCAAGWRRAARDSRRASGRTGRAGCGTFAAADRASQTFWSELGSLSAIRPSSELCRSCTWLRISCRSAT